MTEVGRDFTEFEKSCMAEALRLAAMGLFTTSPNPNVGCVIASANGDVVGRGYHAKAGTPHAEIHALREAGEQAAGATAYVTLEPCSHFGRTPPCADALINAGIARVVVAMQDPYHKVAGRGIEKLRAAGIEVAVGLFAAQAAALNKGFICRATTGKPYVRVKLAQSLDGRTALSNGQSKWITSAEARHDVQFGRAQCSALLTGAGTVMADDPLLNVRLALDEYQSQAHLRRALANEALYQEVAATDALSLPATLAQKALSEVRQPARVVVDNRCEIHDLLQLWQVDAPIWLASPHHCEDGLNCELPAHGEHLWVDTGPDDSRINLPQLIELLGQRDVNDLWVEAGASLAGALLSHDLVDELVVYTAPRLMGPDATGLIDMPTLSAMHQVPQFEFSEVERVGTDLKLTVRITR